jgi:hypothetical protein
MSFGMQGVERHEGQPQCAHACVALTVLRYMRGAASPATGLMATEKPTAAPV